MQTVVKGLVTLLLLIPYVLRDMEVFKVITFFILPFWLAIFSVDMDLKDLLTQWMPILRGVFRPFAHIHLFIKDLIERIFRGRDSLKFVIIGFVIVIPILAIVIPLLLQADLIFKSMSTKLFEKVDMNPEFIVRLMITTIIVSYAYAQAILPVLKRHDFGIKISFETPTGSGEFQGDEVKKLFFSKGFVIIITTVLGTINVVYGLFVYVQIRYLFMNSGSLPDGITYASYAREGFFQLLAVAILNVAMIVLLEFLNKGKHTIQRILEGLTLVFTFVMSVSSFYRMHLYESTYGYTRLRLLVYMFLVFLMIFIIMIIGYLISYKRMWIYVAICFIGIYYTGSSWFNVDDFVLKENIGRYERTGEFDSGYALSLSADSLDRLIELNQRHPELFEDPEYNTSLVYYEGYFESFERWLDIYNDKIKSQPWQSFNFAQLK